MKTEKEKRTEADERTGLVRSDLNLEKWNIFTTRRKKGYRVLERDVPLPDGSTQRQVVKVGLKGATESLTTEEALIFYALMDLWEVQGRPADGVVRTTYNHLLNRLIQKGEVRRGTWSKNWLREKLSAMRRVPIEFSVYARRDGSAEVNVPFTLLSDSVLWDRASAKEKARSGLSFITIHPTIVRNLLEHHVKPVRFDVLVTLKKDISRILYRYFDLILFDKTGTEREIRKLADELDIGAERIDNLVTQLRAACAELRGKDLSNGRIEWCEVMRTADGGSWKLVVKKGKQVAAALPAAPVPVIDAEVDEGGEREAELMVFYETLSVDDRARIEARKVEIVKTSYGGFFRDLTVHMARLDAIEEVMRGTAALPALELVR